MIEQGQKAPDFSFTDMSGKKLKFSDLKGQRRIVYFYPKDNTPGCNAEACNFRDNYKELQKQGFYLIGISPDTEASHEKFRAKFELPFPLVADPEKEIIKSFGAWGPKKFMGKEYEGVLRSTFIIDGDGVVEKVISKVKTKESTEQIFKELNI